MQPSFAKAKALSLKHFTAFSEATFNFSPGINVIIGANATGKSHLLKIIYTLLKVAAHQQALSSDDQLSQILNSKLEGVFGSVEGVSDLIRKANENETDQSLPKIAEISLDYGLSQINCRIDQAQASLDTVNLATLTQSPNGLACPPDPSSLIYLPAQEFLSLNQGFISAYTKRESALDETFYDLSLALNALPLRRRKLVDVEHEIEFLRKLIAGQHSAKKKIVTQENGRFYLNLPEGKLEAHLVAEGHRKMATLLYLLRNGELGKHSILFWDEPEANLNPKLVVKVAKLLKRFADLGMQIFVTTHDYLLSHELSLLAEYPTQPSVEIKFFALHKPERLSGVLVEEGKTLAEIEHNPILNEFTAHYDRELLLFHSLRTQP